MSSDLNIFIIAGEASGDRLGADLLAGLQGQGRALKVQGVGGPLMQDQGLTSLFPITDLSVMGLVEVLPKIPTLLRRIKQTVRCVIAAKPDVLITIDSPDFCLRVVAQVKEALPNLKVVHYVAPSVWAWRPERAEKMAKHVDHVLALLPFEPPFMERAGMSCDFVGHPVTQEPAPSKTQTDAFLAKFNLDACDAPLVTLLPGSRKGELRRMGAIFTQTVAAIKQSQPNARLILPVANGLDGAVRDLVAGWDIAPILLSGSTMSPQSLELAKRIAYRQSSCALATSGTVALELAAADCPMVVAYRANWATTRMVKKLAQIDTANLVNIVTETRVIPEFLFDNCTGDQVSAALVDLLRDPDAAARQRSALAQTMAALSPRDVDMRGAAARSVLRFLGKSK